MFVQTDNEGRILATSENGSTIPNSFEFEFPADFDFSKQFDYIIKDGVLSHFESAEAVSEKLEVLKMQLKETDWVAAKMNDALMNCATVSDILGVASDFQSKYGGIIEQRKEWRNKINELQG